MAHEWSQLGLGILQLVFGGIVSVCGWLILRSVSRYDSIAKASERHAREIRDTRQAVSRIEGSLGLPPYPYRE